MNTKRNQIPVQALIIGACVVLLALYAIFDPHGILFPKCPFRAITGLDCPGCGSQRAIHSLLHGDIVSAFGYNQLLILLLPYLAICIYLEFMGGKRRYPRLRRILMGKEACYIILALFIVFFLARNFLF